MQFDSCLELLKKKKKKKSKEKLAGPIWEYSLQVRLLFAHVVRLFTPPNAPRAFLYPRPEPMTARAWLPRHPIFPGRSLCCPQIGMLLAFRCAKGTLAVLMEPKYGDIFAVSIDGTTVPLPSSRSTQLTDPAYGGSHCPNVTQNC